MDCNVTKCDSCYELRELNDGERTSRHTDSEGTDYDGSSRVCQVNVAECSPVTREFGQTKEDSPVEVYKIKETERISVTLTEMTKYNCRNEECGLKDIKPISVTRHSDETTDVSPCEERGVTTAEPLGSGCPKDDHHCDVTQVGSGCPKDDHHCDVTQVGSGCPKDDHHCEVTQVGSGCPKDDHHCEVTQVGSGCLKDDHHCEVTQVGSGCPKDDHHCDVTQVERVAVGCEGTKDESHHTGGEVMEAERVTNICVMAFNTYSLPSYDDLKILDEPARYDKVQVRTAGLDGLFLKADPTARRVSAQPLQDDNNQFQFSRKCLLALTRQNELVWLISLGIKWKGTPFVIVPGTDRDTDVIELALREQKHVHDHVELFEVSFKNSNLMLRSLARKGYYLSIEKRGVVLRKLNVFPPTENYFVEILKTPASLPSHGWLRKKMTSCVKWSILQVEGLTSSAKTGCEKRFHKPTKERDVYSLGVSGTKHHLIN